MIYTKLTAGNSSLFDQQLRKILFCSVVMDTDRNLLSGVIHHHASHT